MKKNKNKSKVVNLHNDLAVVLLLSIACVAVLSYFSWYSLGVKASSTEQAVSAMKQSAQPLQDINTMKQLLQQYPNVVNATNNLYFSKDTVASQASNDITKYASLSGISLSNVNYDQSSGANITVTLSNNVTMSSLLKFIYLVEHSLPKMYVNKITLSGNANEVQVSDFTIGVALR